MPRSLALRSLFTPPFATVPPLLPLLSSIASMAAIARRSSRAPRAAIVPWVLFGLALPLVIAPSTGRAEVPLPGTSSVSVPLVVASACNECHGSFSEDSALATWTGSAMGHSARDPLFLSALTEAEKDLPGVGDFCLRCHAPEAWLEGRCAETDGSQLLPDDAGVTCSVCHRMDESPWLRNGQYLVADDIDYRGPYADADTMAPHRHQQSSWISDSRLCGACHDLRNPLVERRDPSGAPLGMPFPEQTTYTEWATSAFASGPGAKSCQDCHMPESTGRVAELGPERTDRSSHELSGGNLFVLGAVQFLQPGLGIAGELERGRARIEAQLRTAATLEVLEAPARVARGETFTVKFRVTNETGHKLPTGYPEGRRVWLEVASAPLALSLGTYDEVMGEPTRPAALYHTRHGQSSQGRPGHRVALNDVIYLDTRIPPRGLAVTSTTAPVGKIYPEVSPGVLAHYDDVTVTATVPCNIETASAPVSATLWYQSVTKTYVDALVRENGDHPRGFDLRAAFDEADPGPLEMESVNFQIPIDLSSACAPPDAGVASDASAGDATPSGPDAPEEAGGCGCRDSEARRPVGAQLFGLFAWVLTSFVSLRRRSSR